MSDGPDPRLKLFNKLLRGELSAVETYARVIESLANSPMALELREIREEHALSANRLSAFVRTLNGVPEKDSGVWGIFANAVQGAANHFGPAASLEILREGEELGRNGYQKALLDDHLEADGKQLIREQLLPRAIQQVTLLERIARDLELKDRRP